MWEQKLPLLKCLLASRIMNPYGVMILRICGKAARIVCKHNYNKGSGRKVGDMDALYAAPVDLQNRRLVMIYGALHRAVWPSLCETSILASAYWDLIGGCATWFIATYTL